MVIKKKTHVLIVTGAHLCRNPRVVKEATSLSRAGYRVSVLAPILDRELVIIDQKIATEGSFGRVAGPDVTRRDLRSVSLRIARRASSEVQRRTSRQVTGALGYGLAQMLRTARSFCADYYVGHQEVGAWVVWKLMYEGYKVGADLEDWYSQDLLPDARAERPLKLLEKVEGNLIRRSSYVVTTSHAMADAMAERYGKRPGVIYNAFPFKDRARIDGRLKDRINDGRPSLFWFSQTVGPGRGLEQLVTAMKYVKTPCQLHLRGNVSGSYELELRDRLPEDRGHSLHFHPLVDPHELLSRIAEHDIGLALEESTPISRDLTITNKILQYLLGGLAVVATPTSGQKEVADAANDSVLLAPDRSVDVAEAINIFLESPQRLERAKSTSVEAVQSNFSWETQEPILLRLIDEALSKG